MIDNNKNNMKILRIKEGHRGQIGQTRNPLDGTWTRPSKLLKKVLMLQQGSLLLLMTAIFLPMMLIMLIIDSEMWIIMALGFTPVFVMMLGMLIMMSWSIKKMCKNHKFRITDEELIVENGLLTVNRALIPLIGVQQVTVMETYWGKKHGLKNVIVNTAGNTYIANSNVAWGNGILMGLKNADEVAEAILSRVKQAKTRTRVEI